MKMNIELLQNKFIMKQISMIIIILLSFSLNVYADSPDITYGNGLYSKWKDYKHDEANWNDGAYYGYVIGVADVITSQERISMPSNVTNGQVCMIVGKYLDENPEKLHLPSVILIGASLYDVFPPKK